MQAQLRIEDTTSLTSLHGLDQLRALDGFYFQRNHALRTFDGLNGVTFAWTMDISANPVLESIVGFASLQDAEWLQILRNPVLARFVGQNAFTKTRELTFASNPRLDEIEGLSELRTASKLILSALAVPTLHGLRSLEEVDSLEVSECASLSSLGGLESLSKARSIGLGNNPRLKLGHGVAFGCPIPRH